MRKIFFTALFILAACGTAPPVENDWCYTYNFAQSANGFNVATGQWIAGEGLQTINGNLSFSYEYNQFVTPTLIFITVSRPTGVTGDISITTAGTIYGISSAFSVSMPTDEETVWFTPEAIGDAGKIINVTIDTGVQDLTVKSIRVEGNGATPFPSNPCSKITPTIAPSATATSGGVSTSTPTPTNTPTNTSTLTNTSTPSITPTPSTNDIIIDFQGHSGQTSFNQDGATISISSQFSSKRAVSIYNTVEGNDYARGGIGSGTVNSISTYGVEIVVDIAFASAVQLEGVDYDWFYNQNINNVYLRQLYVTDMGSPVHTGAYGFAKNTWNTEVVPLLASETTLIRITNIVHSNGFNSGSPLDGGVDNIVLHIIGDLPTPTFTSTAQPTVVSSITPFNLPTATPFNYQPTVDLTQTTATPSTTPLPTNTDFPQSTAYITQTVGAGTPTPSVQEIRENEAEYELLEEEQRSNNVVENLLQDILDALSGDGGTGDGDGTGEGSGGSGIGGVSDWASSISDSLYGIGELFGRVGTFFNQSVSGAKALVTSFYTAPLQPIPGLPLCITAPLQHDICAIYYILDWTLFAPETLGSFIIPLVLAIMNVIVIFRVLRYVLKLIKRTEDVTR